MPKKKIKNKVTQKAKNTYLIQNEDEQQSLSWWDAGMGSWTNDPLVATVYKSQSAADKEIDIIYDDGIEYGMMFSVPADPILKKKQEWKENPPIKYLEKKDDKKSNTSFKIVRGMTLLDCTSPEPRTILVLDITPKNSVFTVPAEFPAIVEYYPLEHLENEIKNGKMKILYSPKKIV